MIQRTLNQQTYISIYTDFCKFFGSIETGVLFQDILEAIISQPGIDRDEPVIEYSYDNLIHKCGLNVNMIDKSFKQILKYGFFRKLRTKKSVAKVRKIASNISYRDIEILLICPHILLKINEVYIKEKIYMNSVSYMSVFKKYLLKYFLKQYSSDVRISNQVNTATTDYSYYNNYNNHTKKEKNAEFHEYMKIYYEAFQQRIGTKPKIDATAGRALKSIIKYMNDNGGVEAFRALYGDTVWRQLSDYEKTVIFDLKKLNSQINSIITSLKIKYEKRQTPDDLFDDL